MIWETKIFRTLTYIIVLGNTNKCVWISVFTTIGTHVYIKIKDTNIILIIVFKNIIIILLVIRIPNNKTSNKK